MLKTEPPTPGLLFASFLFNKKVFTSQKLISFWQQKFGEGFYLAPDENPLFRYYSSEMGEDLSRFFVLTKTIFPRELLLSTKLQALAWESNWAKNGRRQVNVDIGFLSPENFILATTKNYVHRVFIGQNIFAELTYYFQNKKFNFFTWTYPDYQDAQKLHFFFTGRTFLLDELNRHAPQ